MKQSIRHTIDKYADTNEHFLHYMFGSVEASMLAFIAGNCKHKTENSIVRKSFRFRGLGYSGLALFAKNNLPENTKVILVRTLATKPKYKGRELASQLLGDLILAANKKKAVIVLQCGRDDVRLPSFRNLRLYYQQHGFESFRCNPRMMYYDVDKRIF